MRNRTGSNAQPEPEVTADLEVTAQPEVTPEPEVNAQPEPKVNGAIKRHHLLTLTLYIDVSYVNYDDSSW